MTAASIAVISSLNVCDVALQNGQAWAFAETADAAIATTSNITTDRRIMARVPRSNYFLLGGVILQAATHPAWRRQSPPRRESP